MKFTKFLFAGAFCAGALTTSLHAAECNVTHHQGGGGSTDVYMGYPATALYLFEGDYLDLSKMSQREPAVKNASGTDTAWVYRSALDSTMIVIVTEKVVKVARVSYSEDESSRVDSLFSVNHKDVYKDEFPRLQKAGVFKGTAEQADSLVNHVFDLCQKFYCKELGYSGCEFNPPELRGRNGGKDVDMVDMPLALATVAGEFTILLDTLNTCPDIKFPPESTTASPAIPGLSQARISFAKLGQSRYLIAGAKPNAQYKAFSLNGQLLKSGNLEGRTFAAPALPVILMLSDEQRIYLK
ncbi:hypothetical protein SAMN05720472_1976 [Fibrobacter sp. UWR3]|uniref:hypothetical protein n=1 Tax=Fibrobacter sp. UWR3 TaxID=1896217 RepID=UPI0009223BD3|nr:hypothetical protein [Fibrobacter sp. UWR3]SHM68590.1 hypothetical protein SAMN05720472_1976 [Fibrobacter sp. UWR3]